jgi:ribosomal protein S18 acetylase RimI-like enzyme
MKLRLIGTVQGRGIGSALVHQIINNARNRGIKTITLETVPEARGFYNKIGFKPTARRNILRYNI